MRWLSLAFHLFCQILWVRCGWDVGEILSRSSDNITN